MSGYKWISWSSHRGAPPNAVEAGHDCDRSKIYVARAFFHGDTLPCKFIPQRRQAYICHGMKEHLISNFEVMVKSELKWVSSSNGQVPSGAVEGGRTSGGEILYIGRVNHSNSKTIGKVHPSHGCLYIPFGGQELSFRSYEVLVMT